MQAKTLRRSLIAVAVAGAFAVGAITADLWGVRAAVWAAAAITVLSGFAVAARMYETHTVADRSHTNR